jgi:hypothetical protein
MTDAKKTEIVETVQVKPSDTPAEYGKLIVQLKKSKEKISRDIEVPECNELIIRNTAELVAVRAIRDQKIRGKISQTQMIMNKFKKVIR